MNNAFARYQRQKRCKKRFDSDEEEAEIIIEEENSLSTPVKLKIKIGTESKGALKAGTVEAGNDEKIKGKRRKKEGESSSEEERWLDAIESGNLHEVDEELKHIQGRKGMTARQRSLLERKAEKLSGRPRPKEKRNSAPAMEISEEMKHKKALETQKRREQAHQKREKDKKQTLDKLLKKQDVKQTKASKAKTASAAAAASKNKAMISYRDSVEGITLSYPINIPFPIVKQISSSPPPVILCGVTGCKNPKKYSCSKSGVNLCSLECYKKNMQIAVT